MIDQIDFLHEFLVAQNATELSIVFMDFRVHRETAAVFQSENTKKKRFRQLSQRQIEPNEHTFCRNRHISIFADRSSSGRRAYGNAP